MLSKYYSSTKEEEGEEGRWGRVVAGGWPSLFFFTDYRQLPHYLRSYKLYYLYKVHRILYFLKINDVFRQMFVYIPFLYFSKWCRLFFSRLVVIYTVLRYFSEVIFSLGLRIKISLGHAQSLCRLIFRVNIAVKAISSLLRHVE